MARQRVDALLVERGLAADLKAARALIMAGQVVVGERRADKAGERVADDAPLRLKSGKRRAGYVSRGGLKLQRGLEHFEVSAEGRVCMDLGASTGGFTDCLLQRGALRVYAVDVAYGVLDWRLRQLDAVVVLERTPAAELDTEKVPEPVELLVADISFNSLRRILAPVLPLLASGAEAVLLVKPQFELERGQVERGGVVRDEALHREACEGVAADLEALGFEVRGWVASPITGAKGNQEFLLAARWIRPTP